MNGQLYQECERSHCDTEPVCVDCMLCEHHCDCTSITTAEAKGIQQRRRAASEIVGGYRLLETYIKEFGRRCEHAECDTVVDTRPYHIGAGYGPGPVFSKDNFCNIYLDIHTASRVEEWAQMSYCLSEVKVSDDDFYTNAEIIRALEMLKESAPLSSRQKRAFSIA